MPHGFPGVASSMNLPNSGWKTGATVPLLNLPREQTVVICVLQCAPGQSSSQFRDASALFH